MARACWNPFIKKSWRVNRAAGVSAREQSIPVAYENVRIDTGFKADLVVEDKVIVEMKSVELLSPAHKKQLLTYLRLGNQRLAC